jgi:hypothetical protein
MSKYDEHLQTEFFKKINAHLKQDYVEKPVLKLAQEVIKTMLDSLAFYAILLLSTKRRRFYMLRMILTIFLLSITVMSAPVTFKDFGAIWLCGDNMDYSVWAEARSNEVVLSQESPKKDYTLKYDKKSGRYLSKSGKITLEFKGKDLDATKIHFLINGKSYKCYYEYIERG